MSDQTPPTSDVAGPQDGEDRQPRLIDMTRFGMPPPLPTARTRPAPASTPATGTTLTAAGPSAGVGSADAAGGYDVVVADDPAVWPGADGSTSALLDLPERDRLPAVGALTARRTTVVIVTKAQEAAVRALAAGARTLFDARIAVVCVDRGPAVRAAAALVGQMMTASGANPRPASEIIARLPDLCGQLGHLVMLRSVTSLDNPAVRIGHHLMSYLPGRRVFVVQTSPQARAARVTSKGHFRPTGAQFTPHAFDPAFGVSVAVLGPRPLPESLMDRMGLDVTPSPMAVTVSPASQWPDPEATEVVVRPLDVDGWVRSQLPPLETWPCHWCGEPLAAPIRSCPFCRDTI